MAGDWLRFGAPMVVFAGFIALALLVKKGERPGTSLRLTALILYAIIVSNLVGFSGRDMWPFAAWRYVRYAVGDQGEFLRLVAVDGDGHEQPLDTRTFEPLEFATVMGDLQLASSEGRSAHLNELLDFLLTLAQAGVADAKAGKPVGRFRRLLGPLAAPVFQVLVTPWFDPSKVPNRIDGLRAYWIHWRIEDGTARVERQELAASTKP
jgi:hypothetical protein